MQVALVFLLWFMKVASQATCFVYFWVAAVGLREGNFSLAEKTKKSVYSICSNIDPKGAFEETQSG